MAELFIPRNVRRFKSIRHFKTPSGSRVIVLPTCVVSLEHLVESNWKRVGRESDVGHVRKVLRISRLSNGRLISDIQTGKRVKLYVKSPEHEFDVDPKLGQYACWSRGLTLTPVSISVPDVRVEKQATWEARILLGLLRNGIKTEVPQAIVIDKDGRRSVITTAIPDNVIGRFLLSPHNLEIVKHQVRERGFVPLDLQRTNVIVNTHGLHIIDVNRWQWPPFTDEYQQRLIKAVHEQAAKQAKPR